MVFFYPLNPLTKGVVLGLLSGLLGGCFSFFHTLCIILNQHAAKITAAPVSEAPQRVGLLLGVVHFSFSWYTSGIHRFVPLAVVPISEADIAKYTKLTCHAPA